MKERDETLREAYTLLRKGHFKGVVRLLEPKIPLFRNDINYYRIISRAYLEISDLSAAETYYNRLYATDQRTSDTLLALALIALKKGNRRRAIEYWLETEEIDLKNPHAKYGLALLRKESRHDDLIVLSSHQQNRLMPKIPPYRRGLYLWGTLSGVALLSSFLVFFGLNLFQGRQGEKESLSAQQMEEKRVLPILTVEEQENLVAFSGEYPMMLSSEEVLNIYERLNRAFLDKNDSVAQRWINEIKLSNADTKIKERAKLLESRLDERPKMMDKTPFTYEEVVQNPVLYEKSFVLWAGRIGNLQLNEERGVIEFNLLVGYEDQRVLKGVVPVSLDFPVQLESERPIRVWGQVLLDKSKSRETLQLRGIGVQQFEPTPVNNSLEKMATNEEGRKE